LRETSSESRHRAKNSLAALRRRHPQPEVTAVTRPVERIDGRLHGRSVATGDLTGVPLLEKGEVAVDQVHLLPHCGPAALTHPGEVLVDLTRRQPPRRQSVVLTDLQHRLGQPVQRGRRQPCGVPRPLVLGQGVEEEALLVTVTDLGCLAPLQRGDVRQARLKTQVRGELVLRVAGDRLHDGQQTTPGINHESEDYTSTSRNPGNSGRIL
jgi:hypothetical protein